MSQSTNHTMTWLNTTIAAALTLIAALAYGEEPMSDARAIVEEAERVAFYSGQDGRTEARMLITDSQDRRQVRQFTLLRRTREDNSTQDMMVFFSRPADVRNTVFRVIKRVGTEDDRWLYLPGLDLVKRISAGDKRTAFVGSHFFYEDVSGRNTQLDNYELLETTEETYRLKGTPKEPESVEFDHYIVSIDRKTMLPVSTDYNNAQGKTYRQMEVLKIETIEGYPTVVHSVMRDLESGGQTDMQFRNVAYDLGLPESVFSERSLRNPPTEWLN